MRKSSVMLEKHTTSFIRKHILQKLGQFLLQKSEVRLSCKTTIQDERTYQLIVQNYKPQIDTETLLNIAPLSVNYKRYGMYSA